MPSGCGAARRSACRLVAVLERSASAGVDSSFYTERRQAQARSVGARQSIAAQTGHLDAHAF